MNELVSIIIPCYNASAFLKDAVNSVFRQSYSHWELILVNDHSTDATEDVILKLKDKYPDRVFFLKTNGKGACDARNTGLSIAQGKYIQFLDADDIILPNKLYDQINFFTSGADVVFSDYRVQLFGSDVILETQTFPEFETNPLYVLFRKILSSGNPLYRKSAVEKIGGYNSELSSAQDWDFHIRLFLSGQKFAYFPGQYFVIRKTTGSVSSDWIKVYETACKYLPTLKNQIRSNPFYSIAIGDYLASVYYLTLIHTKDRNLRSFYRKELFFWAEGKRNFFSSAFKKRLSFLIGFRLMEFLERRKSQLRA